MIITKRLISPIIITVGALACAPLALSQTGARMYEGDWSSWAGNDLAQRYSPLDQINADNVDDLEIAWRFSTANFGPTTDFVNPSTPLEVDGVLYVNIGSTRNVVALDATSGQVLWLWRYQEGDRFDEAPRKGAGRGVAFWSDGDTARVLDVSPGYQLVSLDAKTGIPDPNFGDNGIVNLYIGLRNADDPRYPYPDIGISAPPFVMNDVIVVGAAHRTGGRPRSKFNTKGDIRGFDVRTGELLWTFHTIPQPGEYGHETWLDDSWQYTGNVNVWTMMSADEELGYVYLPIGNATNDHYGGHRPGNHLFANSLVALDARTGERVWHFQFVHHSVWDYDPPAAPNLIDIVVDGRPIKAVAQITKQGFTFVFDRATGEPVWPIEERPVPQSIVIGEQTAPTQPYPTRPPLFLTNGATENDVIDFTPELRAQGLEIFRQYQAGPLYTPPTPGDNIIRPGWSGGANWWGAAFDPDSGHLFVPSWAHFSLVHINPPQDPASDLMIRPRVRNLTGPDGLPLFKPPYSQLVAFDMNAGEKLWGVPVGEGPRDHEALQGLELPPLGNFEKLGGPLLTRTLLFIGQGFETNRLGVYDKQTGEELWWMQLPARFHAAPITYMAGGKQYIVLALGGGVSGAAERLMALTLP